MILQAILSGLATGGVYALVALGFSITFTTTKTLNFAHGEFVSVGAFVQITVLILMSGSTNLAMMQVSGSALQQLLGLGVAVLVMAFVGTVLYLLGVRPFTGKPGLSWVVSTLGFGIMLQALGLALWGPGTVVVSSLAGDALIMLWGASIRRQELLILCVALVISVVLDQAMQRTRMGKVMRAVAHSPQNATLMGIHVAKVMIGAFALSSALAALSGVLVAPVATASIYLGLSLGLKGFSAAIVGGLNNPRGCIVGGFALGVLESLVSLWQAQFREIFVFALVILVLTLRPHGVFGRRVEEKA